MPLLLPLSQLYTFGAVSLVCVVYKFAICVASCKLLQTSVELEIKMRDEEGINSLAVVAERVLIS